VKEYFLGFFLFFISLTATCQVISTRQVFADSVSIRGLSVVDDSVAWLGASKGTVAFTTNGGRSWKTVNVPGHEKSDFRSVYGFSSTKAVIANAGSPANILLTTDGGKNWRTVYANAHADAFIDGVDFWNETDGVIYGDPIDGQMLLLTTTDGGATWSMVADKHRPRLREGEASFAASGTGIRCVGSDNLYIVTGGVHSRLFMSPDKGKTWSVHEPPIIHGLQGTGIFSLAVLDERKIVVVGGDFQRPELAQDHVFYSDDDGKTWNRPDPSTSGYRECVEQTSGLLFAVGPTGVDMSETGGRTWRFVSNEGFHVIKRSRSGTSVMLAGGSGKIGILK
jgi:photosystem II stability/assembly factor-like uncharacterized protein